VASHLEVEAIAERVGFSDVQAFSKALNRRTGRSPSEQRRHLKAQSSQRTIRVAWITPR
jgi:transcriptional regulator GlxA family with amidase domain